MEAAAQDSGGGAEKATKGIAAGLEQTAQAAGKAGATVDAAFETLSFKRHGDIKGEIEKVRAAYETLASSGTLTSAELAQASLRTHQQVAELKAQTNGWSDALLQARGAIAGVVGAGAGLTYLVKQAMDFESAMADVRKVVVASDEEFSSLTQQVQDLTEELPLSAVELAKIAAAGGQLGVAKEHLGDFTRLAAQMGVAFNLSADEAGQAIAKLSNVFDLPVAAVGKLGDAINVLGNNTAATEASIIDALTRIGGSARQFGLAADQSAALSAALIALGKPPQVAATAINALLSKLQTATIQGRDFQDALGDLGLSAQKMAGQIAADPQQALTGFLKTLEQLDKQSRAEIIGRLFGIEYADDIALLVGSLGQYEKTLGLVADKGEVAGAMTREFSERMKTTEAQLDLLKNAANRVAVNLGSALLPAVSRVAEALTGATGSLADFTKEFPLVSQLGLSLVTIATSAAGLKTAMLALRLAGLQSAGDLGGAFKNLALPIGDATKALGLFKASMGVISAALIGWDVGTYLREEFELVRKAGVGIAWAFTQTAEDIRLAWEMTKAVFTDDTIQEAMNRHKTRSREIAAIYEDLWKSAGKAPEKVTAAVTETTTAVAAAADATRSLATTVEGVGQGAARALQAVQVDAQAVAKRFAEITAAGKDAAEAVGAIAEAIDPQEFDQVREFGALLQSLETSGKLSAEGTREAWSAVLARLSAEDLPGFVATAKAGFGEASAHMAAISDAIKDRVHDSLAKLGLDAGELTTGLSKVGAEARSAFGLVAEHARSAGYSAKESGQLIAAAFEAALDKAKSTEDLKALKGDLAALGTGVGPRLKELAQALDERLAKAAGDAAPAMAAVSKAAQETGGKAKAAAPEVEKLAEATEAVAEAADEASAPSRGLPRFQTTLQQLQPELAATSAEAVKAFEAFRDLMPKHVIGSVESLGQHLGALKHQAASLTTEYATQKANLDALVKSLSTSTNTTKEAAKEAWASRQQYALLGAEALTGLRSALDGAVARTESLRASAASTLAGLKNELDQMDKNYAAIEQRAYEARRAELEEKKKAAADPVARREYEAALKLADEIHQRKMDNIAAETTAKKKAAEVAALEAKTKAKEEVLRREGVPAPGAGPETAAQRESASLARAEAAGPSRTIRVEVANPATGQTGVGLFDSEAQAEAFLRALGLQAKRTF